MSRFLFDPRARYARRGSVLLEAMIALAVLGLTISTAAWLASEALGSLGRVRAAEAEVRSGNRFLTAVSLWPVDDLDRRLGTTRQGPWLLRIDRFTDNLYDVTLLSSEREDVPLLRTTLFRGPPEDSR